MNTDRLCPGCMNDNGGEKICSICGYDMSSNNKSFCLPVKFLLSERYVIGKAISVSTEGIIYIAWDNASQTAVHIKEYYPSYKLIASTTKIMTCIVVLENSNVEEEITVGDEKVIAVYEYCNLHGLWKTEL